MEIRPHSSHHAILRHAWANDLGVGSAEIGGAWMCGFFTSVGDGAFSVVLERDADGHICRVTVQIAGDGEEDDDEDDDDDDEDDEGEDDG